MPFHVEISRSVHRARVFNIGQDALRETVLEPWTKGRPLELGDRKWIPSKSELRILEGPELDPSELAYGRGWDAAERSARDVTVAALERHVPATAKTEVGVLAETPWGRQRVAGFLERIGLDAVDWAEVRDLALAGADRSAEGGVAVVLGSETAEPVGWWLFEAGLALGALGRRAIVASLGDQPAPEPLQDLGVVKLDPDEPTALPELVERLRLAGFRIDAEPG